MSGDPGLSLLTGSEVADLLAGALAPGEELVTWRVQQVDHRPGSSTTASYDVTVRGRRSEYRQVLAASVLPHASEQVTVWRFPYDPGLPALATAVDEEAVRALLTSYAVPPGPIRLDVRGYRPRRRALVEVQAPGRRLFLKVLPPKAAGPLHDRHRMLTAAGLPVPRSMGWSGQGLLVLDGLPGATLRSRLREGGAPAPEGQELLALLDRLPSQVRALPARRSWTDEVAHYAGVTAAALPAEASRCTRLATRILDVTGRSPADTPVHGDFYEAQLLLDDGGRITGLLDVDTVGPGRRADDLACLLAHVAVLALTEPVHSATSTALAENWLAVFDQAVDPVDLRARVAGVVVSLATGPYRVQQQDWPEATRARLDLAEQWLHRCGV